MSPESAGMLKCARDRFYKKSGVFEFRIPFRVFSRADLTFIRCSFESEQRSSKEAKIDFLLKDQLYVWRLIEKSDIIHGFPYRVSRIGKASVFPCAGSNKTQGSKFLTGYPSQAENQVTLSLIFSRYLCGTLNKILISRGFLIKPSDSYRSARKSASKRRR